METMLIDALASTVNADHNTGRITPDSLRLIQQELGVNLHLGASNVPFGPPDRKTINVAYLALAIANGLTTAITDATVPEIRTLLLTCNLFVGRDEYPAHWIKAICERGEAKAEAEAVE